MKLALEIPSVSLKLDGRSTIRVVPREIDGVVELPDSTTSADETWWGRSSYGCRTSSEKRERESRQLHRLASLFSLFKCYN